MVFVGLGSLADQVGAKFKSDEKALDIIRRARTAIGGDAAIAGVRSMVITGRTTHTFKVDGVERSEPGESEIALQFPDKLMRTMKIGRQDGTDAKAVVEKKHDVLVFTKDGPANMEVRPMGNGEFTTSDGKKIIVREHVAEGEAVIGDGEKRVLVRKMSDAEAAEFKAKVEADGELKDKVVTFARTAPKAMVRQNELLRHTLALLLTAPEGTDVSYTFAGESDVDGVAVNIVNAEFGGMNYKLYIGKSNDRPVAMSFAGPAAPMVVKFKKGDGMPADASRADTMVFTRKLEGAADTVEHFVRFSEYRSTGGVQLPYRWTTSIAGVTKETFDVTAYDINPANIAEKFESPRTFVRTRKDGQ
jgi:hypothetical protein